MLRAIRGWAEVTQRVSRDKQALSAVLIGCRAYSLDNGGVVIRCFNPFAKGMLDQAESKRVIREALAGELGRRLGEQELTVELVAQSDGAPDETIFDELDALNGADA